MIRIAIADDEPLIREGLEIILGAQPDIEVVALCANGKEAVEVCETHDLDLVLMDIRMPEYDGIYGTREIRARHKDAIKILILTTFQDTEYIKNALQEGASGYLLKDSSYDLILNGIRSAVAGNSVFHPGIVQKMISGEVDSSPFQKESFDLTEREVELILYVAKGLTNQEIADELFLSVGTVKNAISVILQKLDIRDRTQLAIFAYRNHLL